MSKQTKPDEITEQKEVNYRSPRVLTKTESLPSDWVLEDTDDISDIKTGHTPSTDVNEYWDGEIPWIAIHDLSELDGVEIYSTEKFITEEGLANSGAKLLPKGTLALCRTGSIGESAILGQEMATDQSTVNFECYSDLSNPYFLMDIFQWCQPELERLGIGSTHPSIQLSFFPDLRIPTPPIEEQRKIASVLYTVDQAIQKTEDILESLLQIKKELKQHIFSEGYYDHDRYEESNIGIIPEEWDVKPASELCEDITVGIVTGATDHYVNADEGVPFIRSQDVHENHIERDELKYISEDFHKQQASSELHEGDVITVRTGEPGTSCLIPSDLEGANCFSLIISRPKSETNERYYSNYINSPKALDFIDSWKAGGVQDNFNVGVMERLPVPIPSEQEQKRIVEALDDTNGRIAHERQYVSQLKRLKQGLMQDLLSGEIRTHDKDIEIVDDVLQYG